MDGRGECLTERQKHFISVMLDGRGGESRVRVLSFFIFLPPAYFPLSFTPLQLVRGASFLEKGVYGD